MQDVYETDLFVCEFIPNYKPCGQSPNAQPCCFTRHGNSRYEQTRTLSFITRRLLQQKPFIFLQKRITDRENHQNPFKVQNR